MLQITSSRLNHMYQNYMHQSTNRFSQSRYLINSIMSSDFICWNNNLVPFFGIFLFVQSILSLWNNLEPADWGPCAAAAEEGMKERKVCSCLNTTYSMFLPAQVSPLYIKQDIHLYHIV